MLLLIVSFTQQSSKTYLLQYRFLTFLSKKKQDVLEEKIYCYKIFFDKISVGTLCANL